MDLAVHVNKTRAGTPLRLQCVGTTASPCEQLEVAEPLVAAAVAGVDAVMMAPLPMPPLTMSLLQGIAALPLERVPNSNFADLFGVMPAKARVTPSQRSRYLDPVSQAAAVVVDAALLLRVIDLLSKATE